MGPDVSVVVPVAAHGASPVTIFRRLAAELDRIGCSFEFIFVLDSGDRERLVELRKLTSESRGEIRGVAMARASGEAAALSTGFRYAAGSVVVTLGASLQVEPREIGTLLGALRETGADMVVARRDPRADGVLPRAQSRLFHWLVRVLTATDFHDISCGFRAMRREVAENLSLYGDLHRFIPVLARAQGFDVREVAAAQVAEDRPKGLYGPAAYARRLLDTLTIFFLVRFTQRPLRFFGMIGMFLLAAGSVVTVYLGVYRVLRLGPIADRPLLLLGLLLIVAGIQSLSIGLLGELITFTHARRVRTYRVAEVMEGSGAEREAEAR